MKYSLPESSDFSHLAVALSEEWSVMIPKMIIIELKQEMESYL